MQKAQRLIHLMMFVNDKRTFTLREVMNELGVSRRTALRDLMELSEMGVPFYSEVGAAGGYRMLREKVLPPISFTENEALAIFFASQSLQLYRSLPFGLEAESALQKFYHHMGSEVRRKIDQLKRRLVFWVPPRDAEAPYLAQLLDAALTQSLVDIEYESREGVSARQIQPISLYTMNGLWYVEAYCFRHKDRRVFRADRIVLLNKSQDQSRYIDFGSEPLEDRLRRFDQQDGVDLVVRFTREGVRRCKTDIWLSKGLKVHEDGTGTVQMIMSESYIPWATDFFLGFGIAALVMKPQVLADNIRTKLQQLCWVYNAKETGIE